MAFINQHSLHHSFENSLKKLSEQQFLRDYFLVGCCDVDPKELLYTRLIFQLTNSENCSIGKYIKDRVEKTELIIKKERKKRRRRHEQNCDENDGCEIKTIALNEW